MISKDLLLVSEQLNEFKVFHITISIFAIILYFTLKDMQMYCLNFELTEDYVKESDLTRN